MNRRAAGQLAEEAAARFLEGLGLRIIARNVRCRGGEVDLIARFGTQLVFVEVRARRDALGEEAPGLALASVGAAKRRRLVRVARWFLAGHPSLAACPVRFDVVAVRLGAGGQPARVHHVPSAFTVEDVL